MEGRPRNEDDDIFCAKKEAKLELRKAVQNNEIERSIKENNTLMEANFRVSCSTWFDGGSGSNLCFAIIALPLALIYKTQILMVKG